MRSPFSPVQFLLFIFLLAFLIAFVQIGLITIAFDKLGLSPTSAFLLLYGSLLGSAINLPLFTIKSEPPPEALPPLYRGLLNPPLGEFHGETVIAINVGGGLIPIFFSLYLLQHHPIPLLEVVLAIAIVATVSYFLSRPIPGVGIAMPVFIPPVTAALAALLIDPQYSAPLAYIGGTLGVLIGADLLHLKDIRHMGTPMASIGGAGTFDGIFITGIVAVLLA
ncbi:MAG: DUF1614 domain-containing protein [Gammaproteobacteria bacterium]|nr:MAG: DUF1614 domain-containing protein [Gammaproteobacteria bacterium]